MFLSKQLLSSASLNLVVMSITLFCGMIYILTAYDCSYFTTENNIHVLHSEPVKLASYALMFSTFPALLDLCIDLLSTQKLRAKVSDDYFYGRMYITAASFTSGIFIYFASQGSESPLLIPDGPAIYYACSWMYQVTIACSLLNCLCISKPQLFTVFQTTSLSLLICIGTTLRLSFRGAYSRIGVYISVYDIFLTLCIVAIMTHWLKGVMSWSFKTNNERAGLFYYVATLVVLMSATVWIIDNWVTGTHGSGNLAIFPTVVYLYTNVALMVTFTVIPSRIYQYELNVANNKIVETKCECTTFLFQKLRAPLQTVYFGLLIIYDQLPTLNSLKCKGEKISAAANSSLIGEDTIANIQYAFNIVFHSSNEVTTTISNFSYYVELERGSLIPRKSRGIDVRALIRDSLYVFEAQIVSKNITVTQLFATVEGERWLSFYTGPVLIEVDIELVSQVLLNLISNATKFTPDNGNIKIVTYVSPMNGLRVGDHQPRISSTRLPFQSNKIRQNENIAERGSVVIQVIDSGVGLTEDAQRELFQKEIRLKPDDQPLNETTEGLGLWVSKRILEMHDGSICVHSKGEDKGSTFTIELPATESIVLVDVDLNEADHPPLVTSLRPVDTGILSNLSESNNTYVSLRQLHNMPPENRSEALGLNSHINFKYAAAPSSISNSSREDQACHVQSLRDAFNESKSVIDNLSRIESQQKSLVSIWQPRGVSVAIIGPQSTIKDNIVKQLTQKLDAVMIDSMMRSSGDQSMTEVCDETIHECINNYTNVVFNGYDANFFNKSVENQNLQVCRPEFIFLLVPEKDSKCSTRSGRDYNLDDSMVEACRKLPCFEINLTSFEAVEDVVCNVLAIIDLFQTDL